MAVGLGRADGAVGHPRRTEATRWMVYHVAEPARRRGLSTMRRTVTIALALVLALSALAISGCDLFRNPMKDANDAIAAGNVHLRKFRESEDRLKKASTELNSLNSLTSEEASRALTLIAEIKKECTTQRTELDAAAKEIAKVKTYDVGETYKKYADLEVKAIQAQIAVIDEAEQLYGELERNYIAIRDDQQSTGMAREIGAKIDTHWANLMTLQEAASKAKTEADQYFEQTKDQE